MDGSNNTVYSLSPNWLFLCNRPIKAKNHFTKTLFIKKSSSRMSSHFKTQFQFWFHKSNLVPIWLLLTRTKMDGSSQPNWVSTQHSSISNRKSKSGSLKPNISGIHQICHPTYFYNLDHIHKEGRHPPTAEKVFFFVAMKFCGGVNSVGSWWAPICF